MRARTLFRIAVGLLVAGTTGCGGGRGLLGPSCVSKQKTGAVFSIDGDVAAGAIAMHRVPYGTEGSQNNLRVSWGGQPSGTIRIKVYATKIGCVDFSPARATGDCTIIGHPGGTLSPTARPCVSANTCQPTDDDIIQNSLTVVSGQGNPDILGSPAEYKLWVVGDSQLAVHYTISATFFAGPDC